ADIGPDHAPAFFDRVTGNRDPIGERGLLPFDRHGRTLAAAVVAEAVVPALQLLTLDRSAFRKSGTAMRAAVDEQVWLARRVAPQRQLLAQSLDPDWLAGCQIAGFENRVPAIAESKLQPRINGRRTFRRHAS